MNSNNNTTIEIEKLKNIIKQHELGKQHRRNYYKKRYQTDPEYAARRKEYNRQYTT